LRSPQEHAPSWSTSVRIFHPKRLSVWWRR